MIYFDYKNIHFSFSFGFFFVLAFVCSSGGILTAYSLLFCLIHELAHLIAMHEFGATVSAVSFYGGGIKISSQGISDLARRKQLIIYFAGCFVNLLTAFIYLIIQAKELFLINLFLALFNLLPISALDGGKILETVFPQREKLLMLISKAAGFITATAFVFATFSSQNHSFSSVVLTAFVFLLSIILG